MRAGAESQHAQARSTREHIQKLLAARTEAALKLAALEQELALIEAMDPQQTAALEKEVAELAEQVGAPGGLRAWGPARLGASGPRGCALGCCPPAAQLLARAPAAAGPGACTP